MPNLFVITFHENDFRSHPIGSTNDRRVSSRCAADTEIAQLCRAVVVQHDVPRLDVAVDALCRVEVRQPLRTCGGEQCSAQHDECYGGSRGNDKIQHKMKSQVCANISKNIHNLATVVIIAIKKKMRKINVIYEQVKR